MTLGKLIEPLRELGRQGANASRSPYALVVHDWSKIDYDGHKSKTDLTQLSQVLDQGYELMAPNVDNECSVMPHRCTVVARLFGLLAS